MDLEKRIEAQQAKADVMSQSGGSPEPDSFEANFQSFVDKNYPPPTDAELVQEAKRRIMHDAGQVEPGSFEAKFQEFADTNYPKIGFRVADLGGPESSVTGPRGRATSPQGVRKGFGDVSKGQQQLQQDQPVRDIGFESVERGVGGRAQ